MRQASLSTTTSPWLRKLLTAAIVTLTLMSAVTLSSPPQAEAAATCGGHTDESLQAARFAYERKCGQKWDSSSGVHSCKWRDGYDWHCFGPRGDAIKCTSDGALLFKTAQDAKDNFKQNCGQTWGTSYRDKCVWHSDPITYKLPGGWHCFRRPSS